MLLLLIASLSHSAFADCDSLQTYLSPRVYIPCIINPSTPKCEALKSSFITHAQACFVESNILSTSQSLTDFLEGFYNGIQADASKPSPCVQSFTLIKSSFGTFATGFKFGVTPLVTAVFTFNDFIGQLTNTYSLCSFKDVYTIFHPESFWKLISNIAAHILMNQSGASQYWTKYVNAISQGNYISAGIYLGKLFTVVTSYSL